MDWTGSTAYPPVLSLEDMYAGMVAVVGGKAANLGEMMPGRPARPGGVRGNHRGVPADGRCRGNQRRCG